MMVSEIKLFGGTFFSQYFYNNIYKWDLEISMSTSGVKVHYSFSVCVVNYMSTKKKISKILHVLKQSSLHHVAPS